MTVDVLFAPRDAFLVLLAQGWRFTGGVAEPMQGNHGRFAVMLERKVE